MLNKYGIVLEDVSLENYNTYGIKTKAKYLVKVKDINSLKELVSYLNKEKMPYFLLGKGSNVILPDNPFSGVIISLENLNHYSFDHNTLTVEAGAILGLVVKDAIKKGLKGIETLGSIPGTVGGALYGNASFYKDKTIYDHVKEVVVICNEEIKTILRKDIKTSYRYSSFKDCNDIIVKATFTLEKGNIEEMQEEEKKIREKRRETQPIEFKNAGSVFKNPIGYSAGKLIDEAGLKGYHVNDAYVSLKHANFIVNKGKATSKDIKELIAIIQNKIKEKDNITLELEQQIIEWD